MKIFEKEIGICLNCKQSKCNCVVTTIEGVYQLTDLPNMVVDDNVSDKFIGYDHIGENYSAYDGSVIIEDYYKLAARKIKEEINEGILLDLGCGDGLFAIPLVMENVKVIAGDISNKMLMILKDKLNKLNLDMKNISLIRMNAYDIPLIDNSVDAVIANSMLHLNSNPEKIIKEIYRVLKPNGKYICFVDRPARKINDDEFDNKDFNDRLEIYSRYYNYLKELNIYPVKYNWKFDRDKICDELFKYSYVISLDLPITIKKVSFYDGVYKRMRAKGFSDQSNVPDDIHKMVFEKVDKEMQEKFGVDYTKAELTYYSTNEDIKVYIK